MSEQPEFEELEHIPWSALAVKTSDPLIRFAYIAAVVVATIAIGLLAARWLLAGNGQSTVTLPPVAAPTAAVEVATATEVGIGAGSVGAFTIPPESVISNPALYSEADLMAISIDEESRLAVFHAESFLRDYFTVDGDEAVAVRIAALVQEELPPASPTVSSYVEWIRAYTLASPRPGRYRVEVAYQLLVGSNGGFAREPVAAVVVEVTVAVDGTAQLARLPEPIDPPVLLGLDRTGYLSDFPEEVLSRAVERLARFGPVTPIGVSGVEDEWQVVANVEVVPGLSRPMLVVLDK